MELSKELQQIGLNEKEALIYIALLRTGRAPASLVARQTTLKRPTTYAILEDMVKKGVATKSNRSGLVYNAISPEELFKQSENDLLTAEAEALPELMALSRGKKSKTQASYFEGIDGIIEAYKKLIGNETGGEAIGFYADKDTPREIENMWPAINKNFVEHKIDRRVIMASSPANTEFTRLAKSYRARYRIIEKKVYSSNTSINAYKDITFIFSHRYLQGVLIENEDIAKVIIQIFNLVWDNERVMI